MGGSTNSLDKCCANPVFLQTPERGSCASSPGLVTISPKDGRVFAAFLRELSCAKDGLNRQLPSELCGKST
jgi:hypothetical protein